MADSTWRTPGRGFGAGMDWMDKMDMKTVEKGQKWGKNG
jgi:hypothetical protein